MGLGLFKGKEADEIESSTISTAADQIDSPSASTAVQEENERVIHVTYNLRKRKHEDAQDYKEKNRTSSTSSKQLQTLGKKQRKDQQSTALVKHIPTKPTKLSCKKDQQPRSPAVKTSSNLSTNQRKAVQTKESRKNSIFPEFKERLQKRIPRRKKDVNKEKNKMALNKRKKIKSQSKSKSPVRSKANSNSSKRPADDLQKISKSCKVTKRTTQTTRSNSKREMQLNSTQNGQTGSCKTPKTSRKMILKDKVVPETKISLNEDEFEFGKMFKTKLEIKAHINVGINTNIHGICVTNDNLIWVNYLRNHVKLFDAAGNILRSVDLDRSPVFNCCTSNGDLLFTQGYGGGAHAEVILVPREGEPRTLADLTSYAQNLCGILCQEEMIFIACYSEARASPKYFVMKLNMNGEVEGTYETKPETVNINHIISQFGRLYATSTHSFSLLPLENDKVSTKVMNRIKLNNVYSASACGDNLGNILMGSESSIHVLDPSFQRVHKINSDIPGSIISTAVDHQNHLWIGSRDGNLYITKYMQ